MSEKLVTGGRASHRVLANIAYVTLEAERLESQTCKKGS